MMSYYPTAKGERIRIETLGGQFEFYVFRDKQIEKVIERYHQLIGVKKERQDLSLVYFYKSMSFAKIKELYQNVSADLSINAFHLGTSHLHPYKNCLIDLNAYPNFA